MIIMWLNIFFWYPGFSYHDYSVTVYSSYIQDSLIIIIMWLNIFFWYPGFSYHDYSVTEYILLISRILLIMIICDWIYSSYIQDSLIIIIMWLNIFFWYPDSLIMILVWLNIFFWYPGFSYHDYNVTEYILIISRILLSWL